MRDRHQSALLAACRLGGGPPTQLSADDWSIVRARATTLGLTGHLHNALAAVPHHAGMSRADWSALQSEYYALAARNADLLGALGEVLRALRVQTIDVIVLKGAALVESVYQNLAVRPMYDVDLLVRERDLTRAAEALAQLRFLPDEGYRSSDWYITHLHHLVPLKRDRVTIELHRDLLPPSGAVQLPLAQIWKRARPTRIAGEPSLVLSPADLIVHLVLHLVRSHHFVGGLPGLRDVAQSIQHHRAELDWTELLDASVEAERPLYFGLALARDLVGADVPQNALAILRERGKVSRLEERWLNATARRLVMSTQSEAEVWRAAAWCEQLLAPYSWARRVSEMVTRTLEGWTQQGRARGLGVWSLPYGLLVHPWLVAMRRARRSTST